MISGMKSSLHESVGKTNDRSISELSKRSGPRETSAKLGRIGRLCQRTSFSRSSRGSDDEQKMPQKTNRSTFATDLDGTISSNDISEALASSHKGVYQSPGNVAAKLLAIARPQNHHCHALCHRESTLQYVCGIFHKVGEVLPKLQGFCGKRITNLLSCCLQKQQEEEGDDDDDEEEKEVDAVASEAVTGAPQPGSESGMRFEKVYKLNKVLGVGAYSIVKEGFHRKSENNNDRFKLDSPVSYAVKCVDRKKLSEAEERVLLDEVSIMRQLEHPNVIRLLDVFNEPTKYYLVMERLYGGDLFDRICSKSYYDEVEARDCCVGILNGVQHLHDNRIVHRDLKPENLLLSTVHDDVSVKIADFGFAKSCPHQCYLTTLCGTPAYVAPEVPRGWAYDERVDLWSVGVILYILLCGYPPFIEDDVIQLFRKVIKGDYELHQEYWDTVSEEAKELVKSLMNIDRENRLTVDGALLENPWIIGDCEQLERIRAARLPSPLQQQHYYSAACSYSSPSSHREAVQPGGGFGVALQGHHSKQQAHQHKDHDIGDTTAAVLSIPDQIMKKMPSDCQQEHQHHNHDAGPATVAIPKKIIKTTTTAVAA